EPNYQPGSASDPAAEAAIVVQTIRCVPDFAAAAGAFVGPGHPARARANARCICGFIINCGVAFRSPRAPKFQPDALPIRRRFAAAWPQSRANDRMRLRRAAAKFGVPRVRRALLAASG